MDRTGDLPDLDKLWNYSKPAETRARFLELLPRAEASGNAEYRLQLETQVARTWGLEGRFDEAHRVLDGVAQGLEGPGDAPRTARVRYLLERGRVFNSARQADKAKPLFREAWELARAWSLDAHAVDAAHMMAIVEPAAADQHSWNRQALAVAEVSPDPRARGWLGSLYNNIGMTHLDAGEYAQALEHFEKQWAFRKERGTPEGIRIAKWMVAHTYRRMGRLEEALAMQREMEREIAASGEAEDGFVAEEIAEILHVQGKVAEARPYFAQAHAKLKDIAWVRDTPGRLERLKSFAGA